MIFYYQSTQAGIKNTFQGLLGESRFLHRFHSVQGPQKHLIPILVGPEKSG